MVSTKIICEDVQIIVDKLKFNKLHNSKIIITGAGGLVGTYLLATLSEVRKQKGINLKIVAVIKSPSKFIESFLSKKDKIIYCDLSDFNSVKSLPKADFIIHAAGYGQPGKFLINPLKTILINTVATSELIKKLNKNGRFLFISSSELYSGLPKPPYREDQIGTTTPQHIRSCYIEGKRCGEAICTALSSTNNGICVARLSLAYGPGTKKDDQRVVNTFTKQAITKNKIVLLDSGTAKRTYLYISDAVEMLVNIVLYGTKPVYNVGGKSHTSILNLAKIIAKHTKSKVTTPKVSKKILGSPDNVYMSTKLYEKEFAKKNYIGLDYGIKRTIMWQRKFYK